MNDNNFMPPHLADLIQDELMARGWTEEDAAIAMGHDDVGIKLLALQLFLSVRDKRVVLHQQGDDFAKAFGVQRAFFDTIHSRWVEWAENNGGDYQQYKTAREAELANEAQP